MNIQWNSSFQDTGYQLLKGSNPWKMENNRDEPYNYPSLLLQERSQAVSKEEFRQSPATSLSWGEEAESQGRPRHLKFTGQYTGMETTAERKKIWISLKISTQWMRKLPKNTDQHPKGNSVQHTHRTENTTYFHHLSWKLRVHRELGRAHRRSCHSDGK